MIRKGVVALVAMVAAVWSAAAQDGFTKQIEVQKEYEVAIKSAERIECEVALLDTTIVRPELSYRIRPTAHISKFSTTPLQPIDLATAMWSTPKRLYLNVGAGYPLQSEVDAYWSPVQSKDEHLMVWLNHEGTMGKVTTLDDNRTSALTLRNKAGVRYERALSGRTHLSTKANYRGTAGRAYGGVGVEGEHPFMLVNDLDATAKITGDFGASSPLAYEGNLTGIYAWNNQKESVWRFNVNFALAGLDTYHKLLPERVTLHYSGVNSVCREPYYDTSITFVPEWNFRIGRWIPVSLVAGYDCMIYKGANNTLNGVITDIRAAYDRYKVAVPYVTVANDVQTQVTREGLWRNPYMAMLPLDTRKVFLAEVGVRGELPKLSYKLSGATRWFSSYLFEVVEMGNPIVQYGRSDEQRVWYVDAEVAWRPTQALSLVAEGGYHGLGEMANANVGFSPRKWRLAARTEWQPTDHLRLSARCEWRSKMGVTLINNGVGTMMDVPSYVDLGAEVEWLHSESMEFWLRGDNLLGQPIYHWATYPALGAGVRIGARMSF